MPNFIEEINKKKNSNDKKVVRFGEQQGDSHLLGADEIGYLIQMIESSNHSGRHLEIALQCKMKLQSKLKNIMKIKE